MPGPALLPSDGLFLRPCTALRYAIRWGRIWVDPSLRSRIKENRSRISKIPSTYMPACPADATQKGALQPHSQPFLARLSVKLAISDISAHHQQDKEHQHHL